MKPDSRFASLGPDFWAHVKLVSEKLGYSTRKTRASQAGLRMYTIEEVEKCLADLGLRTSHLVHASTKAASADGKRLVEYLNHRRELLMQCAEPNLMDRDAARKVFEELRKRLKPRCALPMNKQKGKKRHHAYMVGIVNMLTEQTLAGREFCAEPRGLCVATKDDAPVRTFSRWMDGAYPGVVNPQAVWEVKEYYGTTTFGSRVADGVYETMLDGHEFAEYAEHGKKIRHYLIVDDHFTWWAKGRSYLCRIVDMMHVGLVDEALFGREVLTRWPEIVKSWP